MSVRVAVASLRHGYLGEYARLNPHKPRERTEGDYEYDLMNRTRRVNSVDVPYGQAAIALGIIGVPFITDHQTGAVLRPQPPPPDPDNPDPIPF